MRTEQRWGDMVYRNFSLLDNSFSHFMPFITFLQWHTHFTNYFVSIYLILCTFFTTCLFGDKSNSDLRWQLRMALKFCICVLVSYLLLLFFIAMGSLKLYIWFLSSFLLHLCRLYTYYFFVWKKRMNFQTDMLLNITWTITLHFPNC